MTLNIGGDGDGLPLVHIYPASQLLLRVSNDAFY